ncbi:MAG: DUF4386 family protein [Desulfobacteraceae bacterium]|nr:DUF4386 family protein [Desulfobacteraceae bacterium]
MAKKTSPFTAAGIISICGGTVIILGVTALKYLFGYPEIIRAEPGILLERLYSTINIVPYLYYVGVGGAGICILMFSVLFEKILKNAGEEIWSSLGKVCGIISGILLYAGIIRYSILFPKLAVMRHSGMYNTETIDLIFKAMNTYIGDSLAEHVQFTFTSFMLLSFGISILRTKVLSKWIPIFGFIIMAVLIIGNLEQFGIKYAFIFNRTGAKLLAVWLILTGIALLKKKDTERLKTGDR